MGPVRETKPYLSEFIWAATYDCSENSHVSTLVAIPTEEQILRTLIQSLMWVCVCVCVCVGGGKLQLR